MGRIKRIRKKIIDLSSDFRLNNSEVYRDTYGREHPKPELLNEFVYAIPEISREKIKDAKYMSGAGCNATAIILGLLPFKDVGIERVIADVKVGSSESGNKPNLGSHHPERSRCIRSFALTGHRHKEEVLQVTKEYLDEKKFDMSVTSLDIVRGILATIHIDLAENINEKELFKIFRNCYRKELFVRIVHYDRGIYRHPEPKILIGTNYCDVGFAVNPKNPRRVVALSAIDNLMKGASGNAVQVMNIAFNYEETTGLEFPGLHPI